VAGFPVSHSKSPLIFNTLFREMGIQACYSRISAGSADEAAAQYRRLGLSGMNITAPLKKEMLGITRQQDEAAGAIGAVNTVTGENSLLSGYNTDHFGVSHTLSENGIDAAGKDCLVIGAGSAARAAAYALTGMGGNVRIINRTYKKAHTLAGDMNCNTAVFENLQSEISDCDILVSTIPSGLEMIKNSWFRKETLVLDAVYPDRVLTKTAESAGCTVIRGEHWLVNQAVPAFRIFTGREIGHREKDKLLGTIIDSAVQVTKIRLLGNTGPIKQIKEALEDAFKTLEVACIPEPDGSGISSHKAGTGKQTFRILVSSDNRYRDRSFFPSADLIIPFSGEVEGTLIRLKKELQNVL